MNDEREVSQDEAQEALKSVAQLESAGWRRGVPARWFGAGVSILIGSMFAVYAFEDPSTFILFPILGLAIFMATAREKSGAQGRGIPGSNSNLAARILFVVVLVAVFFGSIYLRRAYDAAWVSLLTGLIVALFIFYASESERRAYQAKSAQVGAK